MFDFIYNLKIKTKLVVITLCGILFVLSITTAMCLMNFDQELKRIASEDQEVRLKVFWNILQDKGKDIDIIDNKLKIGSYEINGNYELPDKLQQLCGGVATIFMKDTRVSTNVLKPDGTRAVGTQLQGPAYDAVFKDKKSYRGEAPILGEQYFTAYDPIKNSKGEIIGVLFTGVKRSAFYESFDKLIIKTIIAAIIFALLTGIVAVFLLQIIISSPLNKVVNSLRDITEGEGDLTRRIEVTRDDEIGQLAKLFNKFLANLEDIISKVKVTAKQVDFATSEVATGSQGLSQATQEQASAIEQVAATIEQMTSSIKQNASNADQGRDKARTMVQKASASGESSKALMQAMDEISGASKKIGDIIVTVNEVAFQTNLLALNAAVEAARAGEHGKGFAVVAEEVRALAQRSGDAAKQIKVLIQDTVNKVKAGDEMVKKSVESLDEIISHIGELSQTMDEIAASSGEQSTGIDELNRAVSQIDSVTQQNSTTVEELASTSDNLSIEASDLATTVERFRVSINNEEKKKVRKKTVLSTTSKQEPKNGIKAENKKKLKTESKKITEIPGELDSEEGFEEF